MATVEFPERGRKSNGASWARNGQKKRLQTVDRMAPLRRAEQKRRFDDGRWWRFRPTIKQISFTASPVWIDGSAYIVRCVVPYHIEVQAQVISSPLRTYEIQRPGHGILIRVFSLAAAQAYLRELRRPAPAPQQQLLLPAPQARQWKASPFAFLRDQLVDRLLERPETTTMLKHGGKTFRTRKESCAHICVERDFDGGRLKRSAGDPLCQPAAKFPRLLDFIPAGDPVCPKCAEMAERYDLPLPRGVAVVDLPSSRRPAPGDPPVRYRLASKWFSYEYGFPFNGYLRQWEWLRRRTVCHCGARVTDRRGDEPVCGMEIYTYFTCTAGHPIRDERDLRWPGPFIPANAGAEGKSYDAGELLASDAFKHLQAVADPDDVPF